jgi:hypothetical protein
MGRAGPRQAVSGYWHATTTFGDYCRVRSYLVSARSLRLGRRDSVNESGYQLSGTGGRTRQALQVPTNSGSIARDLMYPYGKVAQCA